MKIFEWATVTHANSVKTLSILEILDEGKSRQFWGSVRISPHREVDDYEFVAYSKERVLKTPYPKGASTIKDAQEAVEKFLMDENVIEDGNEVIES